MRLPPSFRVAALRVRCWAPVNASLSLPHVSLVLGAADNQNLFFDMFRTCLRQNHITGRPGWQGRVCCPRDAKGLFSMMAALATSLHLWCVKLGWPLPTNAILRCHTSHRCPRMHSVSSEADLRVDTLHAKHQSTSSACMNTRISSRAGDFRG